MKRYQIAVVLVDRGSEPLSKDNSDELRDFLINELGEWGLTVVPGSLYVTAVPEVQLIPKPDRRLADAV